jgi:hypothetical protein
LSQILSSPPRARTTSLPARATMTSSCRVPTSTSLPAVPTIVAIAPRHLWSLVALGPAVDPNAAAEHASRASGMRTRIARAIARDRLQRRPKTLSAKLGPVAQHRGQRLTGSGISLVCPPSGVRGALPAVSGGSASTGGLDDSRPSGVRLCTRSWHLIWPRRGSGGGRGRLTRRLHARTPRVSGTSIGVCKFESAGGNDLRRGYGPGELRQQIQEHQEQQIHELTRQIHELTRQIRELQR